MKVSLDVGEHVYVARLFIVFECVGLSGAIDLTKVVVTGISLACGARLDEVRDSDCGQQTYDSDHYHYLNQGKTGLSVLIYLHTITVLRRCGPAADRLRINANLPTYCPLRPQLGLSTHSAKVDPEKEQARGETSGLF